MFTTYKLDAPEEKKERPRRRKSSEGIRKKSETAPREVRRGITVDKDEANVPPSSFQEQKWALKRVPRIDEFDVTTERQHHKEKSAKEITVHPEDNIGVHEKEKEPEGGDPANTIQGCLRERGHLEILATFLNRSLSLSITVMII
jgi:hypothetical protein